VSIHKYKNSNYIKLSFFQYMDNSCCAAAADIVC